jgi:Ca-activated chloride channel family protein
MARMKPWPMFAVVALVVGTPARGHADALSCRVALALVVDKSAGMANNSAIDNMQVATSAAVGHLSSNDCFTVIAFDSHPTAIVPLSANTSNVSLARLNDVHAGGAVDVFAALDAAHKALVTVPSAQKRHVILLTVGRTPSTPVLQQLVNTMKSEHMTISAFGIMPTVDEATLQMMATTTGGRYVAVAPPDVRRLPTSFAAEVDKLVAP